MNAKLQHELETKLVELRNINRGLVRKIAVMELIITLQKQLYISQEPDNAQAETPLAASRKTPA